eukprot:UN15106
MNVNANLNKGKTEIKEEPNLNSPIKLIKKTEKENINDPAPVIEAINDTPTPVIAPQPKPVVAAQAQSNGSLWSVDISGSRHKDHERNSLESVQTKR